MVGGGISDSDHFYRSALTVNWRFMLHPVPAEGVVPPNNSILPEITCWVGEVKAPSKLPVIAMIGVPRIVTGNANDA